MDDILELIDFKVSMLFGCQFKTVEDDGIFQEKGF